MNRQVTQQHANAGNSTPATGTSPAEALAHAKLCLKLFKCLADAQDNSMLENRHAAVKQAERSLTFILQNEESFLWLHGTPFFRLCTRAAANSINVVLQDAKSSLLLQSQLLKMICALCDIVITYTRHTHNRQVVEGGFEEEVDKLEMEITAAGLPSALMKLTAAAWQAVQQLDTNTCQQQQWQQQQQRLKHKHRAKHRMQQQQDDQRDRFTSAVYLVERLLVLWEGLHRCLVLSTAMEEVLPLLVVVAATAPTLLQQAARSIRLSSSSSVNSPASPKYELGVKSIAARGIFVAIFVAKRLLLSPQQTTEAQQRQQQIIRADKLPELLLQLIARQAAKLHKMCGGVSQALRANRVAAASSQTTEQQQQDQPSADCVVPPQHLSLLHLLGLSCHTDEDMVWNGDVEMFADAFTVILAAFFKVVRARHTAAQLNSHSIDNLSQQQQQPVSIHEVLPSNLLVPGIKVLIEMLLLLPVSNLTVHCTTLQLLKLLLTTSVTPQVAAAAVGAEHAQPRAAVPWPQLPAAAAAGLLQPVIVQLSQTVICCLLQTDHHHQQQQQQQLADQQMEAEDQHMGSETQRLALLHDYGFLLLTVCQAVESKHIGAVLQSLSAPDLLISLAAIEAVIRAQAHHLAPGCLQQEQQQQPQPQQPEQHQQPEVYRSIGIGTNSSTTGVVCDTPHPSAPAYLLLLPFVSKVVQSLDSVSGDLLQQQGALIGDPSFVSKKLSARLCTLLTTALKVGKCAVATAAAHQQEWVSRQAMENAIMITGFARCWCSAACDTTSIGGSCTAVQYHMMAVGWMFRALQAWSCAMTSWAATYESHLAVAAAPATTERSLPATTVDHQITLHHMMAGLEQALGNAEYILSSLGHSYPALTQQQTKSSSRMLCFELPQLLAEQSTQIRANVTFMRRLVGLPLPTDALTASDMAAETSKENSDVPISACFDGGSKAGSEGKKYPLLIRSM